MKTIKIGRSKVCDCVFDNSCVSGVHASLELEQSGLAGSLKDLGSTNGTYVNKKKITGPTRVTVTDSICFGNEITNLKEIISKANSTKIKVVDSGVDRRTIGKNSTCQIRFTQDDVSREHAVIYKSGSGQIVIEDCGSTNGTYVNGIRITNRVLQPGDKVTITRNYPLQWETIFGLPSAVPPVQKKSSTKVMNYVAAFLLVFVLGGAGYWWWINRSWPLEKIYSVYHNAVCWIYVEYGYKVYVDDKDFTANLCTILNMAPSEVIHVEEEKIAAGGVASQGTAFFISKDGKLATNLHVTRPWLFSNDAATIESIMNKILAYYAVVENPMLNRSKVRVEGIVTNMLIVPDGLPISKSNAIDVSELKGYEDIQKDVAIVQTDTRAIPERVKNVIDINNADMSPKGLTEGKRIFTIGFPYGVDIALNSNKEIKNQAHSGYVTQNLGEFEFGHDCEEAGGASGSPMINDKGRLVGIHHAGMTGVTGAQGFNRAIKAKYIYDLLK